VSVELASPRSRVAPARAAEALAFAFGPLAFLAPLALAPLFAAVAALALFERWRDGRADLLAPFRFWPLAWALVAWATLSCAWAIRPGGALVEAVKLALEVWAGFFVVRFADDLAPRRRDRLLLAVAAGLAVGALVAIGDVLAGGALAKLLHPSKAEWVGAVYSRGLEFFKTGSFGIVYSRGLTVSAIAALPLSLLLWQRERRLAAGALFLLIAGAAFLLSTLAAKLAVLAALAGLGAARLSRRAAKAIAVLAVVAGLLVPGFAWTPLSPDLACRLVLTKSSIVHRLEIWNFAARHVLERPLAGWGLDAARWMPGGNQDVVLADCDFGGTQRYVLRGNALPLHTHNAPLQIWLELGAVGAALAAALVLWAASRAAAHCRAARDRTVLVATLAALFSVGFVSYGVWQSWWIAGSLLVAAFVRAGLDRPVERRTGEEAARSGCHAPMPASNSDAR
jgi:O-antigen ligase